MNKLTDAVFNPIADYNLGSEKFHLFLVREMMNANFFDMGSGHYNVKLTTLHK